MRKYYIYIENSDGQSKTKIVDANSKYDAQIQAQVIINNWIERDTTTAFRVDTIKQKLEQLRKELKAERISYGELAELQSLKSYIEPGDVELLEAAGVPEFV